jgi:hypothetical protein
MDSVAFLRTQDTVSRIWYGAAPKRGIHEQSHGKIEPDWNGFITGGRRTR